MRWRRWFRSCWGSEQMQARIRDSASVRLHWLARCYNRTHSTNKGAMMNLRCVFSCALILCLAMPVVGADAPSTAPATTQAARAMDAIMKDIQDASKEL